MKLKGAFFDESIFVFVTEKYPKWFKETALFGISFSLDVHNSTSPRIAELHLSQIVEEIDRSNKVYVLIGRGCAVIALTALSKRRRATPNPGD
jgi:hypothetical protein